MREPFLNEFNYIGDIMDPDWGIFHRMALLMKEKEIEFRIMIDWVGSLESLGFKSQDINWDYIQHPDLDYLTNLGYIADFFYDSYIQNPINTKNIIRKIFEQDLSFTKYDFDNYQWLKDFLNDLNSANNIINIDPLLELEYEKSISQKSIDEYIKEGENDKVEFKSTLRWDIKEEKVIKDREKDIIKAISGFLNAKGGTLLIGIQDDGSIFGIEKDLRWVNKKDIDGFHQRIVEIIGIHLGNHLIHYVDVFFVEKDKKTVCIISIHPSKTPVIAKYKDKEFFYVRGGNTTRNLKMSEMVEYIKHHEEYS